MSYENRIKYTDCPRKCGGKVMTGEQQRFNARSPIDNKMVCAACFIQESIQVFKESR